MIEEVWAWGAPLVGWYRRLLPLPRLLPLLDAQIARGFIIDHTPGALYSLLPTKQVPTSHVIYEAPAALLSDLRREGRRRVGVDGKVLRSPWLRVGVYGNTTVNECMNTQISNRDQLRPPPVVSDQVCYAI